MKIHKYHLVICFIFSIINQLHSQTQEQNCFEKMEKISMLFPTEGYLKTYNAFLEKQQDFVNDNFCSSPYWQILSMYSSFVGDINANNFFEKSQHTKPISKADSLNLTTNVLCKNAINFISNKASEYDIVLFNEAHHLPECRVMLLNMLDSLYKLGFRYLAMEALSHKDTNLTKRSYPIFNYTGPYINEPRFSNLVREAIKKGFELVSYDYGYGSLVYDEKKDNYCDNIRDLYQAKNINNIFLKDKNAKVIVYAGFAHIEKQTNDNWIKMAEYLQILSNKKMLSIDQIALNNLSFNNCNTDEPYTLQNKENQNILLNKHKKTYDIQIIHPRYTVSIYGRPTYLKQLNNYSWYSLKKYRAIISKGYFVQCFYSNEKENPIPVDQFIINNISIEYALRIPKGEFLLKIFDGLGVLKKEEIIKIN